LRYDQTTKAYFTKRTAEGRSKKEIFRCLKRYVAREVYTTLIDRPPGAQPQCCLSTWN